jgi:hypothetical protein
MFTLPSTLISAAYLLRIASAAITPQLVPRGQDGVTIYNNCAFDVYSVTIGQSAEHQRALLKPGSWNWQPYYEAGQCKGVSIKMSKEGYLQGGITQLEYTPCQNNQLWYDLSNIDCGPNGLASKEDCPFYKNGGMFLRNDAGAQVCPSRQCKSNDQNCHDAYNAPTDDWATTTCQTNQNTVLFTCSEASLG